MPEPIVTATATPAPVATTPEPSTASTTADIVQETLGSLNDEGSGDSGDYSTDAPASTEDAPQSTTQSGTEPTQTEIDELAAALGITGEGTAKWKARVPYSKVNKIWKEQQAKLQSKHEAAIKGHTEKLTAYQQRVQDVEAVEQMIQSNPEQFIAALTELNPAYKQYFTGGQGRQAVDPYAQAVNADGTINLEVFAQQIEQRAEQRVAQRYAPIEKEHQARALYQAALPKVQSQLNEAEKWPMFAEHKTDILKALQADQKLGLLEAYQKVVIPKLAAGRDTMRAELLAELKGRPHSTSVISSAASTREDTGPADTGDIVRRVLSGLK